MTLFRGRCTALLLYSGLVIPFGILVHLFAEIIGLKSNVIPPHFILRHAYLLCVELLLFLALIVVTRGSRMCMTVSRVRYYMNFLPGRAQGPRFLGTSFVLQLVFACTTLYLENTSIRQEDFLISVGTAFLGSLLGAFWISLFSERIIRCIAGMYVTIQMLSSRLRFRASHRICATIRLRLSGYQTVVGNRPPP